MERPKLSQVKLQNRLKQDAVLLSLNPHTKNKRPQKNNNLVLTRHDSYSGEYLPEVVTVQTNKCSEVCMKMTEDYNSPVRLEQAGLITNLFMAPKPNLFIFNLLACKNKNTWFKVCIANSGPSYLKTTVPFNN